MARMTNADYRRENEELRSTNQELKSENILLKETEARLNARLEKAKEVFRTQQDYSRSLQKLIDSIATTETNQLDPTPTKENCKKAAIHFSKAGKLMKGGIYLFEKTANEGKGDWLPLEYFTKQ